MNRTGWVAAAVSVAGVWAATVWWMRVQLADRDIDAMHLAQRLRRLEAPHDVLPEEIELPESWL